MLTLAFGTLAVRARHSQALSARTRAHSTQLCASLRRFLPSPVAVPPIAAPWSTALRTDAAGTIVAPNDAAARWLNVPSEALVGMRLLHFVARRDTGVFRALIRDLGCTRAAAEAMVRLRPRQGSPQLVRASVRCVGKNLYEWAVHTATPAAPKA